MSHDKFGLMPVTKTDFPTVKVSTRNDDSSPLGYAVLTFPGGREVTLNTEFELVELALALGHKAESAEKALEYLDVVHGTDLLAEFAELLA